MALSVLDAILMETDASPLKAALLESGRCVQADGQLDAEMSEVPYIIICRGTEPEAEEALEKVIFGTLRRLAREGIDRELCDAAIHGLEFERLEITSDFGPFGLTLFIRAAIARRHGGVAEQALTVKEQFRRCKEKSQDPKYFPGLIKRFFLDNPHFVRLTMKPSTSLEAQEAQEEREELAKIRKALSKKEEIDLVRQAKELKAYQDRVEKGVLETLPKVTIADVPKRSVEFPLREISQGKGSLFHHACHTNHILYADLFFALPALSEEELPYVKLLMTLLPQLGSGARDYKRNLEFISRYLGDFGTSLRLTYDPNNPKTLSRPLFALHGKALLHNTDKLFLLLKESALASRFDEAERIKNLILQMYVSKQNGVSRRALSYAVLHALSGYGSGPHILQKWNGIDYFHFITSLATDIDAKLPPLLEKLQALRDRLFHLSTPSLVVGSDVKQLDMLIREGCYGLCDIPGKSYERWHFVADTDLPPSQGRYIATPVAFSAWGFDVPYTFIHPHAPALHVLTYLLENTYLHRMIRERGGAYGSGACYNSLQGTFHFYGYRDPHIASTYQAFAHGIKRIADGKFDAEELEAAKLGLIQHLDAPVLPGRRAITAYMEMQDGYKPEHRQMLRDRALALRVEDVREVVQETLALQIEQAVAVTVAGKELIEKEKEKLPFPLDIRPL